MRIVVALALFLQGCATTYQGPGPDTSLTGAAAIAEAQNFSFDESHHFFRREAWFEVGPARTRYTIASLRPTIERISPEALAIVDDARVWRRARFGLLAAAAVAFIMSMSAGNPFNSEAWAVGGVLLFGGSLAAKARYDAHLRDAAATYNRDLRSSFSPALGMAWAF